MCLFFSKWPVGHRYSSGPASHPYLVLNPTRGEDHSSDVLQQHKTCLGQTKVPRCTAKAGNITYVPCAALPLSLVAARQFVWCLSPQVHISGYRLSVVLHRQPGQGRQTAYSIETVQWGARKLEGWISWLDQQAAAHVDSSSFSRWLLSLHLVRISSALMPDVSRLLCFVLKWRGVECLQSFGATSKPLCVSCQVQMTLPPCTRPYQALHGEQDNTTA